jgi:hypothetical protein
MRSDTATRIGLPMDGLTVIAMTKILYQRLAGERHLNSRAKDGCK